MNPPTKIWHPSPPPTRRAVALEIIAAVLFFGLAVFLLFIAP